MLPVLWSRVLVPPSRLTRPVGRLAAAAAAAALVALTPARARADGALVYPFVAGSAGGAFNGGTPAGSASLLGLTFNGSTFSGQVGPGYTRCTGPLGDPFRNGLCFLTLDAAPGTGTGGANVQNLGSFTLATGTSGPYSGTFSLFVTLTDPASIGCGVDLPLCGNVYELQAGLSSAADGTVSIDFPGGAGFREYAITTPDGKTATGRVDFSIPLTRVRPGETVAITGTAVVTPAVVPEPATMALLASGLGTMGVGTLVRRRRASA